MVGLLLNMDQSRSADAVGVAAGVAAAFGRPSAGFFASLADDDQHAESMRKDAETLAKMSQALEHGR